MRNLAGEDTKLYTGSHLSLPSYVLKLSGWIGGAFDVGKSDLGYPTNSMWLKRA